MILRNLARLALFLAIPILLISPVVAQQQYDSGGAARSSIRPQSYPLLTNASTSGAAVSPAGGLYYLTIKGTPGGATLTLTITLNTYAYTTAFTAATSGPGVCIAVPASATVQMTVSGGSPSGLYATIGGVGPGGCPLSASALPIESFGGSASAADNSGAVTGALAYLCALSDPVTFHVSGKPTLVFGSGQKYTFTSGITVSCPGISFGASGPSRANFLYNGSGTLISLGTYSSAPANYFPNTAQDFGMSNISVYSDAAKTEGARTGIGLQDNGSGGLNLTNVIFRNFSYGIALAYGSDLDTFIGVGLEGNDVNLYEGPGTQQLKIYGGKGFGTIYAGTIAGIYCDQCGQTSIYGVEFINNAATAGNTGSHIIKNNNTVGTANFFGTTILASPAPTNDSPFDCYSCWFEANAGSLGAINKYWFNFTGTNVASTNKNLTLHTPYFVFGGSVVSGSAVFAGNQSSGHPQQIFLDSPTWTGTGVAQWFLNVDRSSYTNILPVSVGSLLPIQTGGSFVTDRTVYNAQVQPTSGYWSQGTIVPLVTPTVTAGKYCLASYRASEGTASQANVAGTDWYPICAANSNVPGIADATTYTAEAFAFGGNSHISRLMGQTTTGITTVATTVFVCPTECKVWLDGCTGTITNGICTSGNGFLDEVMVSQAAVTATAQQSFTTIGTPGVRAYTNSGAGVLQMTDTTGTSAVNVFGFAIGSR